MGSQSDHSIMKDCEKILKILKVKYQVSIVSAHRTPKRMFDFADKAEKNGFGVIVAGCRRSCTFSRYGGIFNNTTCFGVPIETKKLKGLDSLLSMEPDASRSSSRQL